MIFEEGNGNALQYSCLENPMGGGVWWAAVHGVTKSWTRLSYFTLLFTFMHCSRKWQLTPVFLPGKPKGQRSLEGYSPWGCRRVGHDLPTKQQLLSQRHHPNYLSLGLVSEKAMAPHSSTLAWKIPWMEERGRLQSMGSLRAGHD